jgi:hypothetical protein
MGLRCCRKRLFLGQYALCQPYVSGIVNKIRMDFGIGYTVFKISKEILK